VNRNSPYAGPSALIKKILCHLDEEVVAAKFQSDMFRTLPGVKKM